MNVLVAYMSRTGNTQKICEATRALGVFNCQGQMSETIINMLLNHPDPKAQKWGEEYIPNELPDASSNEKARAFARDIMKTVT